MIRRKTNKYLWSIYYAGGAGPIRGHVRNQPHPVSLMHQIHLQRKIANMSKMKWIKSMLDEMLWWGSPWEPCGGYSNWPCRWRDLMINNSIRMTMIATRMLITVYSQVPDALLHSPHTHLICTAVLKHVSSFPFHRLENWTSNRLNSLLALTELNERVTL